jgi:hypothetical protein
MSWIQPKEYRQYKRLNDKAWLKTLLDSIEGKAKVPMPSFPPADLQAGFVGSSNEHAIEEAWNFYKLMADQRQRYGVALGPKAHVLPSLTDSPPRMAGRVRSGHEAGRPGVHHHPGPVVHRQL